MAPFVLPVVSFQLVGYGEILVPRVGSRLELRERPQCGGLEILASGFGGSSAKRSWARRQAHWKSCSPIDRRTSSRILSFDPTSLFMCPRFSCTSSRSPLDDYCAGTTASTGRCLYWGIHRTVSKSMRWATDALARFEARAKRGEEGEISDLGPDIPP